MFVTLDPKSSGTENTKKDKQLAARSLHHIRYYGYTTLVTPRIGRAHALQGAASKKREGERDE